MGRSFGLSLLLACAPALVAASPADDFAAVRKQYGITTIATPQLLRSVTGEGYFELQGRVTGSVGSADGSVTLLVRFGDVAQVVSAKKEPEWFSGGTADCRMIVHAVKNDLAMFPNLELVASLPEMDAADLDVRTAADSARKEEADRLKAETKNSQSAIKGEIEIDSSFFNKTAPPNALNGLIGAPINDATGKLLALVPDYTAVVLNSNPSLQASQAQFIAECVLAYSTQYGVDARLVLALIDAESGFDPMSTSSKGAQGLGQLMPDTSQSLGIRNPYDIEQNIYGTVRWLRGSLDRQSKLSKGTYDQLIRALAAYNAGSGAVDKYNGVPPYAETQAYVRRVVKKYLKLSGQ